VPCGTRQPFNNSMCFVLPGSVYTFFLQIRIRSFVVFYRFLEPNDSDIRAQPIANIEYGILQTLY